MSDKHTPTPWRATRSRATGPIHIIGIDGRYVMDGSNRAPASGRRECDVDFIIKACNSYDDLIGDQATHLLAIARLTGVVRDLVDSAYAYNGMTCVDERTLDRARDVLARGRGGL